MKNNKLLSYYELRKLIDEGKCFLNDRTLDYFEALLSLDISVLDKTKYPFNHEWL